MPLSCSVLLQAGADVNNHDNDGWTPLHAAAYWGQKEACELLVENFCDMDIKNYVKNTQTTSHTTEKYPNYFTRYRKIPKLVTRYRTVPKLVTRYRTVPKLVTRYRTVPKLVTRYRTVPKLVTRYRTVPKLVTRYRTVPKLVTRYRTVPKLVTRYRTVPKLVTRYRTVPKLVTRYRTVPKLVTRYRTVPKLVTRYRTVPKLVTRYRTVPKLVTRYRTVPQLVTRYRTEPKLVTRYRTIPKLLHTLQNNIQTTSHATEQYPNYFTRYRTIPKLLPTCRAQTAFDVADTDMQRTLEELKKKQAALQRDRGDVNIVQKKEVNAKKRISANDKTNIIRRDNASERHGLERTISEEETVDRVKKVELEIKSDSQQDSGIPVNDAEVVEEETTSESTDDSETSSDSDTVSKDGGNDKEQEEKRNRVNKDEPSRIPSTTEVSKTVPNTAPSSPSKTTTLENNEPSVPLWRRPGSFKSRATSGREEVPGKALTLRIGERESPSPKATTPTGAANRINADTPEVVLRRTQSFEADEKFRRRYMELQARIKAGSCPSLHACPVSSLPTRSASLREKHLSRRVRDDIKTVVTEAQEPPTTTATLTTTTTTTTSTTLTTTVNTSPSKTSSTSPTSTSPLPGSQVRRSFVPPVRDEESETQRKAHAKRVRETRRSTQGVTLEELKSAEQLIKKRNQQQLQQLANEQIVLAQYGHLNIKQESAYLGPGREYGCNLKGPTDDTVCSVGRLIWSDQAQYRVVCREIEVQNLTGCTGVSSCPLTPQMVFVSPSTQMQSPPIISTPNSTSITATITTAVPTVPSGNVSLKDEGATVQERRPSWRLRVDNVDRSKFLLEDARNRSSVGDTPNYIRRTSSGGSSATTRPSSAPVEGVTADATVTIALRRQGKPPEDKDQTSNELRQVQNIKYLRSVNGEKGGNRENLMSTAQQGELFSRRLKDLLRRRKVRLKCKEVLYRAYFVPIVTHAAETWTMNSSVPFQRGVVFKMSSYHRSGGGGGGITSGMVPRRPKSSAVRAISGANGRPRSLGLLSSSPSSGFGGYGGSGYLGLSSGYGSSPTSYSSGYSSPLSGLSTYGGTTSGYGGLTFHPSSSSSNLSLSSSSSNSPYYNSYLTPPTSSAYSRNTALIPARTSSFNRTLGSSRPSPLSYLSSRSSSLTSLPASTRSGSEGYSSGNDYSGHSSRLSSVSGSGDSPAVSRAVTPAHSAKEETENGELDYKKLYEEAMLDNERLREKLKKTDNSLSEANSQLEKISVSGKSSLSELEKRERRAMERKLSEMEEELKQLQKLKAENERLKAENRALTRVVSKLTNSANAGK
uniref:cGMP-dependent protein kinase interacting domain-containing protein n=1 Tax=Timema poppense TaxID=170557 RepID=A0A7R9CZY3_TIMPO|nr:unnamed protein product [Timema poppensis]